MRGTVGISGGREVEEGYEWRVEWGLLYYILNCLTGETGSLTSGYFTKMGGRVEKVGLDLFNVGLV